MSLNGVELEFGFAVEASKIEMSARTGAENGGGGKLGEGGLPVGEPDIVAEGGGEAVAELVVFGDQIQSDGEDGCEGDCREEDSAFELVGVF